MSAAALVEAARSLSSQLAAMRFAAPVAFVYNPLDYAFAPHELYLRRYGEGRRRVVFVGMNPGPFGMMQTGVPFGEIAAVRDWMGIEGPVRQPAAMHPKRPIEGFRCYRSGGSGKRQAALGLVRATLRQRAGILRGVLRAELLPVGLPRGERAQSHARQAAARGTRAAAAGLRRA